METKITTTFNYEKKGVKLSFTLSSEKEKEIFLEFLEQAVVDIKKSIIK